MSSERYDRFAVGTGLVGWVFEYANRAPRGRASALATGIEIGVQLAGEWRQASRLVGSRTYGPGDVHVLWPGECYRNEFAAPSGAGVQVGFILYPDQIDSVGSPGTVLVPTRLQFEAGDRLLELCCAVRDQLDRGGTIAGDEVVAEIVRWVTANAHSRPADPLLAAKREIDRTFDRPLYMSHFGEIAGMHPATLARRFRSRFGVSPARYRVMLRLNEAARRCWSRPELPVAEIAADVGFEDLPYFYRAFRTHCQMTPDAYRHRGRVVIAQIDHR